MSKVAIVGTGNVGLRIAEELLKFDIDEIGLYNRTRTKLSGLLSSLRVLSKYSDSGTYIRSVETSSFGYYDAVVVCAKDNYDPRRVPDQEYIEGLPHNLRYAGLSYDLPIMQNISKYLTRYEGKVIVVSNPVDLLTALFGRWLETPDVIGLGLSVDSLRILYQLSVNYNVAVSPEILPPLVGAHAPSASPVISHKRWQDLIAECSREAVDEAITKGFQMAFDIVESIGYTSYDCGAVFAQDIAFIMGLDASKDWRCFTKARSGSALGGPYMSNEDTGTIQPSPLLLSSYANKTDMIRNISSQCKRVLSFMENRPC